NRRFISQERPTMNRKPERSIHLALLLAALAAPLQAATPARVDLRSKQTPLVNQGGRDTCTKFASAAALEAAYRRAGYKNVKLSEEFAAYTEKMFWLGPGATTGNGAETQCAAFGGGNVPQVFRSLTRGLAWPEASYWKYVPGGYTIPKTNYTD